MFGPSSQSVGMVTVTVPMICMVGMVTFIGMVILVGVMVSLVGIVSQVNVVSLCSGQYGKSSQSSWCHHPAQSGQLGQSIYQCGYICKTYQKYSYQ